MRHEAPAFMPGSLICSASAGFSPPSSPGRGSTGGRRPGIKLTTTRTQRGGTDEAA